MNLVELAYRLQPEEQQSFLMDVLNCLYRQEISVENAKQVINIIFKKKARRLERSIQRRMSQRLNAR